MAQGFHLIDETIFFFGLISLVREGWSQVASFVYLAPGHIRIIYISNKRGCNADWHSGRMDKVGMCMVVVET